MPAKSKAQQRFMGMVHALQKGEIKPSDVSDKVKKAADSMSDKDAEDFASTKHKGLPKKVKEALLRENPAAAAAAAMVMIQMQNPDTGNKVKAITPLRNKDHKLHGKAKGIFKRLKDKFSKKSESVEEGFGGDLKGSDKKKFEKARKENAEVLGYELTGTSDIKESVNEKVIKVSKKDDVPGNPMKMKGEEKIKKLAWSGSVGMKKPGSYEIKGNKLNVNNIRPRDKGFFVRHFTMGTGFRKANLYYDGVHWQGKKKF